jgi:hypothetical protein
VSPDYYGRKPWADASACEASRKSQQPASDERPNNNDDESNLHEAPESTARWNFVTSVIDPIDRGLERHCRDARHQSIQASADNQPGFFVQTMKVGSEIGHLDKSNFVPLFNTIVKRKQHGNDQRN